MSSKASSPPLSRSSKPPQKTARDPKKTRLTGRMKDIEGMNLERKKSRTVRVNLRKSAIGEVILKKLSIEQVLPERALRSSIRSRLMMDLLRKLAVNRPEEKMMNQTLYQSTGN